MLSSIRYSHIVTFWGIKCLYSETDNTLLPIGKARKILFEIASRIHDALSSVTSAMITGFEPGYPLRVIGIITEQTVTRGNND